MSDDQTVSLLHQIRIEMNRGFSAVNKRLEELEHKYVEAVEVLPITRRLETKINDVLHHQEEGGRMAARLLTHR